MFQLLQLSVLPLGYRLTESAGDSVGTDFLRDDPLIMIDSKDFRLSVTHSGSRYHNSFKILIKALRWTATFLHLFSSSSSNKMMLTEGN